MNSNRPKLALIENHELGVYSIRHDLVLELSKNFEITVLTEVDDSFKNGDLEHILRFIDVGKCAESSNYSIILISEDTGL